MSAELVPSTGLPPAEQVIAEIEAAKAAGDIGRVMDAVEGLDAIQRFLKRRREQRGAINRAGAEKVRTERWIGLCVLTGQVGRADLADLSSSTVQMWRYFARASEDDFEQAIAVVAADERRTVTTYSVRRALEQPLDPEAERQATAKRRAEERRLRDIGRRELERQAAKKQVSTRARPLEVALGAIHEALRTLSEFELRDENERVAYSEALRMLHGAEDFVKITAGHVHGERTPTKKSPAEKT